MELSGLKNSAEVEEQQLSDTRRAEERKLPGTIKAKEQGFLGFSKPETLSAIIKIRFTKPISIIELIFYLCQR